MNFSLRSAMIAAVVLVGSALAPQAAPAAVTCAHDGGFHSMNVTLTAAQDRATISREDNGVKLAVNGVLCGAATVLNTDGIYVEDISGFRTIVEIDASEPLAPGFTNEGPSSEIELSIKLGAGYDTLMVDGDASGAVIALGTAGINLNAGTDAFGGDPDVASSGVEDVMVTGGAAADRMSGQGGAGTGSPDLNGLTLYGGLGDDELHGGESAADYLDAGAGNDLLVAGSQGARLLGGTGDDTIVGGAGYDAAAYVHAPAGVRVDLAAAGPQDTHGDGVDTITSVEKLFGSTHDDVLTGDGGSNELLGGGGDDVLDGRDGADTFFGGDGADTLLTGSGDDLLQGGAGEDTVSYADAPAPVSVDLSIEGVPQDTVGSGMQTLIEIEGVAGSPFADRLIGSAAPNAIDGGAGADTIDGREGADRLGGGAGIDMIDSRDSSPDSVSCGEGPDSLAVDALDAVAPDCAPQTPGGDPDGPGSPPGGAPVLTVSVPRQSLRSARAHGLRVLLACSTACKADGRLAATRAAARPLGLGRRASKRLGRLAPIDLAAATPTRARVRLTRTARRALRDTHRVALVLRAHAVDDAGRAAAPVRLPVTLRAR